MAARGVPRTTVDGWDRDRARTGHPEKAGRIGRTDYPTAEGQGQPAEMTTVIPLTEDEQAAVDDGQAAIDRLLSKLADTPTPARPTPRQLAAPGAGRLLPVIDVRHGKT
jgi:hypothetical protein